MTSEFKIQEDDLSGAEIQKLLRHHLEHMAEVTPSEYVFALPIDKLRQSDVTFWSVWDRELLIGCGALREISEDHGEVKSMRTIDEYQRKGVGRHLLNFIIREAKERGYTRLSLETGSQTAFEPARSMYEHFGFKYSGPFAEYKENPSSVFMSLCLRNK